MSAAAFGAVNARQELLGKKTFANPETAQPVRCASSTATSSGRDLSLLVFNIQEIEGAG